MENVLQKNLRKAESGSAFLEYLEAQILKIYSFGANHGNAIVGSMFAPVCPKKLWIRRCYRTWSCHVPRASRIRTWGTIFTGIFFSVFREWVLSWLHAFLINNLKTFAKKLLAVRPENVTRRKKRKTRMTIAKLLAFHTNAIKSDWNAKTLTRARELILTCWGCFRVNLGTLQYFKAVNQHRKINEAMLKYF